MKMNDTSADALWVQMPIWDDFSAMSKPENCLLGEKRTEAGLSWIDGRARREGEGQVTPGENRGRRTHRSLRRLCHKTGAINFVNTNLVYHLSTLCGLLFPFSFHRPYHDFFSFFLLFYKLIQTLLRLKMAEIEQRNTNLLLIVSWEC